MVHSQEAASEATNSARHKMKAMRAKGRDTLNQVVSELANLHR